MKAKNASATATNVGPKPVNMASKPVWTKAGPSEAVGETMPSNSRPEPDPSEYTR